MSMRIHPFGAALALLLAAPVWAQSGESGVLYRCPGNDYSNTITAAEAEKLHCKKVEGSVTIVRSPNGAASAAVEAESPPARIRPGPMTESESAALRTRASNARRNLESRLKSEQSRLSALEQEFNGGEPERHADERDLQTYLDRVARMRTAITRKQIEIAELQREMDKLPTR